MHSVRYSCPILMKIEFSQWIFEKHSKESITFLIFNTCIGHLLLFCTMTNKCTIVSQIITLLHVSTLSSHSQGVCNQ